MYRVLSSHVAIYISLQTQEVAKDFGAVCTPEFFLFKKVANDYPSCFGDFQRIILFILLVFAVP